MAHTGIALRMKHCQPEHNTSQNEHEHKHAPYPLALPLLPLKLFWGLLHWKSGHAECIHIRKK